MRSPLPARPSSSPPVAEARRDDTDPKYCIMLETRQLMRSFLLQIGMWALSSAVSSSAIAQVSVSVGVDIAPPPDIVFSAPPEVVVLPETAGVYVVPEAEVDVY